MENIKTNNVGIYIDGENISYKDYEKIYSQAAEYGNIIIKKVYSDFSQETSNNWNQLALKEAFDCIHQPSKEKDSEKINNAIDIRLIIDLLIDLFERNIDTFIIATNDSDYATVIFKLKEREKIVIGLGNKNVSKNLVKSFSEFIYLDEKVESKTNAKTSKQNSKTKKDVKSNTKIKVDTKSNIKTKVEETETEENKLFFNVLDTLLSGPNNKVYLSLLSEKLLQKDASLTYKNSIYKSFYKYVCSFIDKQTKYKLVTEEDNTTKYITFSEAIVKNKKRK